MTKIGRLSARSLALLLVLVFSPSFAAPSQAALSQAVTGEQIAPGVVRFWAGADAKAFALPSISLQRAFPATGPAPAGFAVEPMIELVDDITGEGTAGQRTVIEYAPGTSLYGTGEVPGQLLRNGRRNVTWNTDAYGYGNDAPSLYQSHPWVLAVRADGSSFGVLADTTYRVECDLRETGRIVFNAEGRPHAVIVIEGATPQDVVKGLATLTGTIAMPPKWAIGYHQCRYSYYPQSRGLEIAQEFRKRRIPADVLWHYIDYIDGFRTFTFEPEGFPDPAGHNATLHEMGFKAIWMINPGVKAEEGYWIYDEGEAGDHWVKRADGSPYRGEVWPGMCAFPDFTRAETREWWAGLYKDFMATGIDGVWNDMNEPAIFNVASKTMPEDNLHRADSELGGPGPHARFHNVYGKLMVEASREGIMAANPDKRPFVLSRANFIGGHRYAATWSGDNVASWDHLEWSVPMTLNLGLSGNPFNGPDIGGFAGNGDAEMFARWMGVGAMLPFARGHTGKGNIDKEPWSFGADVEASCRRAIERRYMLMPFFYTLFREASINGMPVARPLFFADPVDPALRSEDDAFLLGSDLIVAARLTPEADRAVVLPNGIWNAFDFNDGEDINLPRLFLRGGAIVPTGPVTQHVDEKPLDPLTLLVALDENGSAEGVLYEDAGEGYRYREGEYSLRTYRAERRGDRVVVSLAASEGDFATPDRELRVRVIGPDRREWLGAGRDGADVAVEMMR